MFSGISALSLVKKSCNFFKIYAYVTGLTIANKRKYAIITHQPLRFSSIVSPSKYNVLQISEGWFCVSRILYPSIACGSLRVHLQLLVKEGLCARQSRWRPLLDCTSTRFCTMDCFTTPLDQWVYKYVGEFFKFKATS